MAPEPPGDVPAMLNGEMSSGVTPTAAPLFVATDGSVRKRIIAGSAWLASSGEYGLDAVRHSTKMHGSAVVLVAEVRAIGAAVQKLRGRDMTIYSDNAAAVELVERWTDGHDVLPKRYPAYRESGKTPGLVRIRQTIYEHRDQITVHWVKGHSGEPLNEGAHRLARLASRFKLSDGTLNRDEYRCRAEDLADTYSREFNRRRTGDAQLTGGQPPHTTLGIGS